MHGDPIGLASATGDAAADLQEEAYRSHQLRHRHASLLVLGSSRSRWAIQPQSWGWPGALNASIGGTHVEDLVALGALALRQKPLPEVILLELHPWLSVTLPPRRLPHAWGPWFAPVEAWRQCGTWRGWQATQRSWQDLASPHPHRYASDGHVAAWAWAERAEARGHVAHWRHTVEVFGGLAHPEVVDPGSWLLLKSLQRSCADRGVRLIPFLPPTHAWEQRILRHRFGRQALTAWRRQVVHLFPGIWDFSQPQGLRVAPLNEALFAKFLDPSHARPVLGAWTWASLGLGGPGHPPPHWGRQLLPRSLATMEASDEAAYLQWWRQERHRAKELGIQLDALIERP